MFSSLPAGLFPAMEQLRCSTLTRSRSTLAHWSQVALFVVGLSTMSWAQCFQTTSIETGGSPESVAVGDFNGDYWDDMAVSNGSNTSIFLNNQQGGFGPPTNVAPSSSLLQVSDVNGDTRLDLVTRSSILLGNGQGGFQATANGGGGLAVGDLNGDGWPDLLGLSQANSYDVVTLQLNNGKGGFGAPAYFNISPLPIRPSFYSFFLTVGDFNVDGNLDVVVARSLGAGDNMRLLVGDGKGNLGQGTSFSIGNNPYVVKVGDLNKDGRPDLAILHFDDGGTNNVSVSLGNGQGGFGSPTFYVVSPYPRSLAISDFNGDSQPDLMVAHNNQTDLISLLAGNGQGMFGAPTNFTVGTTPVSMAVGDFNADNRSDLVVANNGSQNVSVLYNCTPPTGPVNPIAIAPTNVSALCSAGSLKLKAVTTGFSPTAYSWSSQPAGLTATGPEPTFTLPTVSSPTPYILTVSATDGSTIHTASVNLTVEPLPQATLSNSGPISSANPIVMLTASGGQGYAFSGPDLNQSGYSPTATVNTAGPYSVTVTSATGCRATASTTVLGSNQPVLTGLELINANNGEVISPLTQGQEFNLSTLPTRNLSIRANANAGTGSVSFALTGAQTHNQTDSAQPFALFGNTDSGGYVSWTPPAGPYSLTVTPYAQSGGQAGEPIAVNFTVYSVEVPITSLSLINADNGQAIGPLTYGQVLDLSTLPTRNLSIQANAFANSVTFTLSGPENHTKTESVKPFALFGDTSGDYIPWTPLPGSYTLTVTASGRAYTTVFTVVDPLASPATLSGLSLINADNGQVIGSLTNGQKVNLTDLPTRNLSIRADASASTGSVKFALGGTQVQTYTDSAQPFALFGNLDANGYISWTPSAGDYTLTVTPYNQPVAGGSAGRPISLRFTVLDQPATLLSLLLVNADTGAPLSELINGQAVNLATLPTRKLSVRALTNDATGSVSFALTGAQNHSKTESGVPFALFGDSGFDKYNPWTPPLGQYSLTVTPYSQSGAGGNAGQPVTVNFTVIDEVPVPPALTGLSLINASNGQVISSLTNGQVLNLAALPTRNLSIRADANQKTNSVSFMLSGTQYHTKTESVLPFALFGDVNFVNYNPWTPAVGQYYLTVKPYAQGGASGEVGQALVVNFRVEDQAPARRAAESGENPGRLAVSVLGNPTPAESVEVDIRGAAGGSLDVVLLDEQGRFVSQQHVERAQAVEHRQLQLGRRAGLYLLRVVTPTEAQTVRVLRVK